MQTAGHGTLVLIITSVLLLVSLCVSCREQPGPGGPVIYPRGWPIKSLKVPEGSLAAKLQLKEDGSMEYSNGSCVAATGGSWAVGFDYSGDWDTAISEIENSISELHYQGFESVGGSYVKCQGRTYHIIAPNHENYILEVTNWGEELGYWSLWIRNANHYVERR